MVGSKLVERQPHRNEFPHRAREKFLIRVQIVDDFAGISVDDSQSPHRIFIKGLIEHRLHIARQLGRGNRFSGTGSNGNNEEDMPGVRTAN